MATNLKKGKKRGGATAFLRELRETVQVVGEAARDLGFVVEVEPHKAPPTQLARLPAPAIGAEEKRLATLVIRALLHPAARRPAAVRKAIDELRAYADRISGVKSDVPPPGGPRLLEMDKPEP